MSNKSKFIVITPDENNLLEHLLKYKENNQDVEIKDLYFHMVKYGNYSFLCVNEEHHKKALIELRIRLNNILL